jgi:hypothetical protein
LWSCLTPGQLPFALSAALTCLSIDHTKHPALLLIAGGDDARAAVGNLRSGNAYTSHDDDQHGSATRYPLSSIHDRSAFH